MGASVALQDLEEDKETLVEEILRQVRGFAFGRARVVNGSFYGPILRPYFCLLHVYKGEGKILWDDREMTISTGQAGIIASLRRAEFHYPKGLFTSVSWCEGYLPEIPPKRFLEIYGDLAPICSSDTMKSLQDIGLGLGTESNPEVNAFRNSLGHAQVRAFLFEASKGKDKNNVPHSLLTARRYISDHLEDENLSLSLIAEHVGISQPHLIVAFRRYFGITPSRYIWSLRASKAREMLIQTTMSQAEIAYRCGYKSLSHFSRSLKKSFGATPASLRKSMGFTQSSNLDSSVRDILY